MSTIFILRDADFSVNKIFTEEIPLQDAWFIDDFVSDYNILSKANVVNGGWAFSEVDNAKLIGRSINAIMFVAASAGTLNLYKKDSTGKTLIGSVTILSSELNTTVLKTFETTKLAEGETLILGEANTAGSFYYYNNGTGPGFYGNDGTRFNSTMSLNVKVGYQKNV